MNSEIPLPSSDEERRKAQLRQAGEEYFDKVLASAGAGKDPFQPQPPPRRPRRDVEAAADPDLETVGALLEGARLYVLSGAFVAGHAASLVLVKASISVLATPAILVFLHSLPLVGALAGLSAWSGAAFTMGPFTGQTLLGAAPTALLGGLQRSDADDVAPMHSAEGATELLLLLQTVLLFAALQGGSVFLVLAWTTLAPHLLDLQRQQITTGSVQLQPQTQAGLGLGVGGLALLLAFGRWPGCGCLLWLLLWAAAEAGRLLWVETRRRTAAGQTLGGMVSAELTSRVGEVVAAEGSLSRPTSAFLEAALPAVPALLLGFVFLEGRELVDHELSVPAVSTILLSMALWAGGRGAGVLLAEEAPPRLRTHLASAALLATVFVEIGVHGVGRLAALLGTLMSLAGTTTFRHSSAH